MIARLFQVSFLVLVLFAASYHQRSGDVLAAQFKQWSHKNADSTAIRLLR